MPEKQTLKRARQDKARGKAPSTQAGEFVREEIHHIRKGKHGARSAKQAIAIGLSKARRAGVKLPPPKPGTQPTRVRKAAERDLAHGRKHGNGKVDPRRSRAVLAALRREENAVFGAALAAQARSAAGRRSPGDRASKLRKKARVKKRSRSKSSH
jgi:hypothetical protein